MEKAKEFLEKAMKDEALKERLTGKEPAEVLAVAKELDLECTPEELEAAELSGAAGGGVVCADARPADGGHITCTNPGGHSWVLARRVEEDKTILGFIPWGKAVYNYYKCAYCHRTKREEA